ncbi:type II toxin-antitoxin system RelE/ParE family toxin [Hugenholtzia roseola]|uniref:type II toxin-antitoxin system RelE/ParE family toxin n=1 Tax=Hugenholtzia roseola TaxID=1002 RepID=UPI0003FFC161|nr:type II toxin-antitoxin system RelE/ParE family toxin [Hugenholtzia roseola]
MEDNKVRNVAFYKSYFFDFFAQQRVKVQEKILWTLKLLETIEQIPTTYLKHIEDTEGLYEVRVKQGSDIFRIFCFFDKGNLIVLANGFHKKTQKTPKAEIQQALKIKQEYESEQKSHNS